MRAIFAGLVTSALTGGACGSPPRSAATLAAAVLVDVVDPHERARADEHAADLRADPAAATGDERAPAGQIDVEAGHARSRSDFHDDGDDDRAAARALVDEPAERPAGVAADRLEVGRAFARGLGERRRARPARASSSRSSASGAYTQPRVTISGPVTTSPVRASIVTITTTTPSSASARRSRSTPWPMSPTMPSTYM